MAQRNARLQTSGQKVQEKCRAPGTTEASDKLNNGFYRMRMSERKEDKDSEK